MKRHDATLTENLKLFQWFKMFHSFIEDGLTRIRAMMTLSLCFPRVASKLAWPCLEHHKKCSVLILDNLDDVSQEQSQESLDLIQAHVVRINSNIDINTIGFFVFQRYHWEVCAIKTETSSDNRRFRL
jgi:hypothetical protein